MRIGVDIGGTFTDVVIQSDDGTLTSWKVSSTPPQFADGVLNGVAVAARDLELSEAGLLAGTKHFVHGTTVTTNVVLTRSGARVGLLTTQGFGDTYRLARQYRGNEQDPALVSHPVPLVPREDIEEIAERVDYQGTVVAPIDRRQLEAAVERLLSKGIRSFAICFLWSFRNAVNERVAEETIRRLCPDAYVAASYAACPVAGEYERTSTAAITAYTGPALHQYALGLERELEHRGFGGSVLLMKSDGGPASIEGAVRAAAQTIYSGPAAGVVGAQLLGRQIGADDLITFDMGGTSTDVAIIHDGEVRSTTMQFLDRQALATPMIDVTTVGAGGGSLAWVANDGTLKVGPESAGADPGPACYGRGGTRVTVTDANLVLGLLDAHNFLGGGLQLDAAQAAAANARLAAELGMKPDDAAHGIFRVVNAVMADAIRLRTVYAGLDPREFLLVSFGGAGGLHCASVARDLGIREVVVPRMASTFSAVGLVTSDLSYSFARSTLVELAAGGSATDGQLATINGVLDALASQAATELAVHGLADGEWTLTHSVEMSYRRQILDFEIDVPALPVGPADLATMVRQFDRQYAVLYGPGAAAPESGYSLKNYRVVARSGIGGRGPVATGEPAPSRPAARSRRLAVMNADSPARGFVEVFGGDQLVPGAEVSGPAVIEYADTTVFVPLDAMAVVDGFVNLRIKL
jgi:N-methylhydantoinase A